MAEITKFQSLMEKTIDLNNQTIDELKVLVKANGGLVRTDNFEKDETMPTLYCVAMMSDFAPNHEYPVLAVAVDEDDNLMILPDFTEGYQNLGEMSREDILNLDDWLDFYNGYVCANATLYNMCDVLPEYAKVK